MVVANIPKKRVRENGMFGKVKRARNVRHLEKLEEWKYDCIHVYEEMN